MSNVEHRLARLLDASSLARVVPHLPPETLHQLIRHRGLDACGELVTSATPAQLASLLDLDLWREARPGCDQQFDVTRFGEWLEVLADTGGSIAARTVAALDEDLVVAGLSRFVRVFDPGIFEPAAQSDDEPGDRGEAMREGDAIAADDASAHESSGTGLECEIGGYVVRARRADAWDAIVTLLAALDTEHAAYFHAVMQGCRDLSNSRPEIDGLDDLLPAPAQQLHDVAIEREERRSLQGYATPADARAFLQMARQPRQTGSGAPATGGFDRNPIVAAYFRAADAARESSPRPASSKVAGADRHEDASGAADSIEVVMALLEAGVMPARPRALLALADTDPQAARLTLLRRLMACVRDADEAAYFARTRELAFLANTLLAGCSVQSRAFTPQEASDAAASVCNLGLEHWPAQSSDALLVDRDLVTVFEVGWSVLHQEVSMFVAQQLISVLDDLQCVDADLQQEFAALRRTLAARRDAGTPWLARGAAEVLGMIDMTAWIGVAGLLDECPVLPAALTAILEGRTTAVSATAFDFISTAAQIADVRTFMRKLAHVLSS
ncbi:MAG TPA: DUF6178 family protein [Vicinamibacterales bacterium]|nr:DUF6178 family protein [Vicinamibacterales bacterium]